MFLLGVNVGEGRSIYGLKIIRTHLVSKIVDRLTLNDIYVYTLHGGLIGMSFARDKRVI